MIEPLSNTKVSRWLDDRVVIGLWAAWAVVFTSALLLPRYGFLAMVPVAIAANAGLLRSGVRLAALYDTKIDGFRDDYRLQLMWFTGDYFRLGRATLDSRVRVDVELSRLGRLYRWLLAVAFTAPASFLVIGPLAQAAAGSG